MMNDTSTTFAAPPKESRPPALPNPEPESAAGVALASAAMVLGITALVLSPLVIGAVWAVLGLTLGAIQLSQGRGGRGMATTGIVTSVAALLFSAAASVAGVKMYQNYQAQVREEKTRADAERKAGGDNGNGAFSGSGSGSGSGSDQANGFGPIEENQPFELAGKKAPDFTVTTTDGRTLKLSELRGKRVVLDFWATWCGPCVMEVPHFIKLREAFTEDDVVIVGISDESEEDIKAFMEENHVNYAMAHGENLPPPFSEVQAIPTTFFIDRNGVFQARLVGYNEFETLKKHAEADDVVSKPADLEQDKPESGRKKLKLPEA